MSDSMKKYRLHVSYKFYPVIIFAPDLKSALGLHVFYCSSIFGSSFVSKALLFLRDKKE